MPRINNRSRRNRSPYGVALLPPEVLYMVFTLLAARLICRRWNALAPSEAQWARRAVVARCGRAVWPRGPWSTAHQEDLFLRRRARRMTRGAARPDPDDSGDNNVHEDEDIAYASSVAGVLQALPSVRTLVVAAEHRSAVTQQALLGQLAATPPGTACKVHAQ